MIKSAIKKLIITALAGMLLTVGFSGCAGAENKDTITVITRERGSGTRDAFIELTGILLKGADGSKTDNTTEEAITIDGTQAVMSNVIGNEGAIGYISLGSLNSTVKAVKVEGVDPSPANVKNSTYKLSRPFNIAIKTNLNEVARDFIDYIMSKEGQSVVESSGYVTVKDDAAAQKSEKPTGKIVIAGSSSVSPVMEKLKEAYLSINTNATIEIQTTDSSSGIKALQDGTCDIGMASRELKESEKGEGAAALTETTIAKDGIVIIVNKNNNCDDLTMDQIKGIFTGEVEKW